MLGKRYSGNPSTNSPVNTPTYCASLAGLLNLGERSEAHPVSPRMRSAQMATHTGASCSGVSLPPCMILRPVRPLPTRSREAPAVKQHSDSRLLEEVVSWG